MKHRFFPYIITIVALATAACAISARAQKFSEMGETQLLAVLAAAEANKANVCSSSGVVSVTAPDMVKKIYGIVDPEVDKKTLMAETGRTLGIMPVEDSMGIWMESSDGYGLNYYGMCPEVTAVARYENDNVSDFGYFFLFPYERGDKKSANARQSEFCGSLLQEMEDTGMNMWADAATSQLFEAMGEYGGSFVDVKLIDEPGEGAAGRYILILSVEPQGFTAMDTVAAL